MRVLDLLGFVERIGKGFYIDRELQTTMKNTQKLIQNRSEYPEASTEWICIQILHQVPVQTIKTTINIDQRKVNEVLKIFDNIGFITLQKETKAYSLVNIKQYFVDLEKELLRICS